MIYLNAVLSEQHSPQSLPAAVRAHLGKPLRRAAPLSQLALVGALNCLPARQRQLPTALLWQSTSGPRPETMHLLDEVCTGTAEPMPYDFLATQPALATAQIQPFLPGLQSATHVPLDTVGIANWSLLISLAGNWLHAGRYGQVLCAHLDRSSDLAIGHWLALSVTPLENSAACLHLRTMNLPHTLPHALPDTPDFPVQLASWLAQPASPTLHLQSTAAPMLAVEFARI